MTLILLLLLTFVLDTRVKAYLTLDR